jgi:hypothetical protein
MGDMKALFVILAAVTGVVASASIANAQEPPPYVDTNCGTWQGDTWVPNGNCANAAYRHERVAGTIIVVKGHLVTVQQAARQVVIDDSLALNNQLTGRVAVGRRIIAHGYWEGSNFYATLITTGNPAPATQ